MWSFGTHSTNWYGPAPARIAAEVLAVLLRAVGEIVASACIPRAARSAEPPPIRFSLTVWVSTTSTLWIGSRSLMKSDLVGGSLVSSMLNLTASASKAVPSWNLTSLRSFKIIVFSSGVSHDSTSPAGG